MMTLMTPSRMQMTMSKALAERHRRAMLILAWTSTKEELLAGFRVLDLTRVLAGPVATRFLAGYGAQVLRIDPAGWCEPGVVAEVTLGKRCARLDLRKPEGRQPH